MSGATSRVERIDRVPIRLDGKVTRDERGYARVWGKVIHSNALLPYGRADGVDSDNHVEFVPESTVNDADAIESLMFAPITMPHPPEMLDAKNTSRHQIGTIIDTRYQDGELQALHLFTDSTALDRIDGGIIELSPGYTAEVDETPGEFEGQSYHAIQRKRRYNHNAVIPEARAGHGNRLFVDGVNRATGLRIQVRSDEETNTMAMVTIDGEEIEVPDAVASELARLRESQGQGDEAESKDADDDEEELADAPASLPDLKAPSADSAPADKKDGFDALLKRLDGIEERVAKRVETRQQSREDAVEKARLDAKSVLDEAKGALSKSYKADGKSAAEIMYDAIVAKNPDLKAKADAAKSDGARLRGMFDSEMAHKSDSGAHDLGDDVHHRDSGDIFTKRVDAAREAHRRYRVIGNEAMRHDSVLGVN